MAIRLNLIVRALAAKTFLPRFRASDLLERYVDLAALFQPSRNGQILGAHEVRVEQL